MTTIKVIIKQNLLNRAVNSTEQFITTYMRKKVRKQIYVYVKLNQIPVHLRPMTQWKSTLPYYKIKIKLPELGEGQTRQP